MALQEIYEWFEEFHPFYCDNNHNWRNSVRHTLSSNKLFRRIPKYNNASGRGSLWVLNELFARKGRYRKGSNNAPLMDDQEQSNSPKCANSQDPGFFEWCLIQSQDNFFHTILDKEINWSQPIHSTSGAADHIQIRSDKFAPSVNSLLVHDNNLLKIYFSGEMFFKSDSLGPFATSQIESKNLTDSLEDEELLENLFPYQIIDGA